MEIPSPLSGEYAGDTTLRDLLVGIADDLRVSAERDLLAGISDDLRVAPDSMWDLADEFGNEYEDAYRCAWQSSCEEILWATIQAAVQS